jgi:hypothetical protein
MQILQGDSRAGFAFAGVPDTEVKRDLLSRTNARPHQYFQQQLEPLSFKTKAINGFPPHDEKAGHRICNAQLSSLQWQSGPVARAGDSCAHRVPAMHTAVASVAAGDRDVAALAHCLEKSWEQLRRMLKISVDDSEEIGV